MDFDDGCDFLATTNMPFGTLELMVSSVKRRAFARGTSNTAELRCESESPPHASPRQDFGTLLSPLHHELVQGRDIGPRRRHQRVGIGALRSH
jgi:hypothetical protein